MKSRALTLAALFAPTLTLVAQQPTTPPAGSNWARVQALAPHTLIHVTTDHGGHNCHVFAVADDSITCDSSKGRVIPRNEIQHIKLAHYGRSTLVGAGLGAGIGALAGAVGGKSQSSCPANSGTFCLNGIGIGTGGLAAIFGVAGGVLGAAVGGPTDFTRGSSIYVRP